MYGDAIQHPDQIGAKTIDAIHDALERHQARGRDPRRRRNLHEERRRLTTAPLLEMRGIAKRFPGVVALGGVSFDVRARRSACPRRRERRREIDADENPRRRAARRRGPDPAERNRGFESAAPPPPNVWGSAWSIRSSTSSPNSTQYKTSCWAGSPSAADSWSMRRRGAEVSAVYDDLGVAMPPPVPVRRLSVAQRQTDRDRQSAGARTPASS